MSELVIEEQQNHFKFLATISDESLIDICKLALEYLRDGPNLDKYSIAAEKLQKSPDFIQQVVESILFFLIQSTTRVAQIDTLNSFGFSVNQLDILGQFLHKQRDTISKLLNSTGDRLHFRDLEWRIETRVASRCLLEQMTPLITVKMHLDHETINENKDKLSMGNSISSVAEEEEREEQPESTTSSQRQVMMQIDPGSLRGIIEGLESAILDSKTRRTRLIRRALQNKH